MRRKRRNFQRSSPRLWRERQFGNAPAECNV
jgi:hypothetical protein